MRPVPQGSQNYHAPIWAASAASLSCVPSCKCVKKEASSSHHTLQTPSLLLHSPSNKLFPKHLQHTIAPGLSLLPLLKSLLTPQRCQMPTLPTHPPPFGHLCILPQQNRTAPHSRHAVADYCWWAIMSNWKCFQILLSEILKGKKKIRKIFFFLLFNLQQIGLLLQKGIMWQEWYCYPAARH